MAKIDIGKSIGRSTTTVRANLANNSQFEIRIGDACGMSTRQIDIIERDNGEFANAVRALDQAVAETARKATNARQSAELHAEADRFKRSVNRSVSERRWAPISAQGLVNVAKTIGAVATPVVGAAAKVVELLNQIQGS